MRLWHCAKVGTCGANVVHLKSVTAKKPAALPSHFCYAKDARELGARDASLDSHPCPPLRRCV
ncbi:hypothetical protein D1115_16170 [Vibrio alfacsensis]|uniref:Uncharacterized protein n=1 Tax=Vibrio alfacsensis TaxID=1074311 RepID=A0ABM6YXE3_9VIBR|nr:hypothetical protein D1115_16170 [Vibrio alfacsensis]